MLYLMMKRTIKIVKFLELNSFLSVLILSNMQHIYSPYWMIVFNQLFMPSYYISYVNHLFWHFTYHHVVFNINMYDSSSHHHLLSYYLCHAIFEEKLLIHFGRFSLFKRFHQNLSSPQISFQPLKAQKVKNCYFISIF